MQVVSNEFKTAIRKNAVYSDGYFIISDNASYSETFNADDIAKIEITATAFDNDKVVGNIAQSALNIELLGNKTKSIPRNKELYISLFLGIRVNETDYEYVQFQDFLLLNVTHDDVSNVTKIIATDDLVKLNHEYVDENSYPLTLKEYVEDVLIDCGLSLENDSFLNDDYTLLDPPFQDYTSAREIISKAAELALSFVVINRDTGSVEFKRAFNIGYTHEELEAFTHEELEAFTHEELGSADNISQDHYWELKLKEDNFGQLGINTLVLKISQVEGENNTVENEENVAIDGAIELVIEDNDFINSEYKRLQVIDDMFDVVNGFKYQPFVLEYRGFPYLELGDTIAIDGSEGSQVYAPILDYIIRYDGGLYGKISAKATSKTQTSNKFKSKNEGRIRRAEVSVAKAQGEITLLAEQVEENEENLATLVLDYDSLSLEFLKTTYERKNRFIYDINEIHIVGAEDGQKSNINVTTQIPDVYFLSPNEGTATYYFMPFEDIRMYGLQKGLPYTFSGSVKGLTEPSTGISPANVTFAIYYYTDLEAPADFLESETVSIPLNEYNDFDFTFVLPSTTLGWYALMTFDWTIPPMTDIQFAHFEVRFLQLEQNNTKTAFSNEASTLSGAKYVFDGENASFYDGGLRIFKTVDEIPVQVFGADIEGDLWFNSLEIKSGLSVFNSSIGVASFIREAVGNSSGAIVIGNEGQAWSLMGNETRFAIYNGDTADYLLYVDLNGNVGIGTGNSAISNKLEVAGVASVDKLIINDMGSSSIGGLLLKRTTNTFRVHMAYNEFNIDGHNTDSSGLTMDEDGNVSIGGRPDSEHRFRVRGDVRFWKGLFTDTLTLRNAGVALDLDSSGSPYIRFDLGGTVTSGDYRVYSWGSSRNLSIEGMGDVSVVLDYNDNATGKAFRVRHNGEGSSGSTLFYVLDSGNVGFTGSLAEGTVPFARTTGVAAATHTHSQYLTSSQTTEVYFGSVWGYHFRPRTNDTYFCGSSSYRWSQIWQTNGSVTGSDVSLKDNIVDIENGVDFILDLKPRQYKMKGGKRKHFGFIAQEVKNAIEKSGVNDVGIYINPIINPTPQDIEDRKELMKEELEQANATALRYEEFIAPMVQTIQYLNGRIDELEKTIKENEDGKETTR